MISESLKKLPPYLFDELDRKAERKRKEGVDIIDFGVGDPDIPTPEHIVEACCKAARKKENHRYPSYEGKPEFRQAVAERFKQDFGVDVDPEKEVISLIGSKEGIHNVHFAFINRGDYVLYPDPGYPVYKTAPIFAGARTYKIPLLEENKFLPDLEKIPEDIVKKAKIMWINYPNNPTTAVAEKEFYKEVVDFAFDNNIIVCSDEAYSHIVYDHKYRTILQVSDAKEVCIVFNSLSKTYNMTGWRIGYAIGGEELIKAFRKVKTNVDSGVSNIIQDAAIVALTSSQDCVRRNVEIYKERRDVLVEGLRKLGFKCEKPKGTFYLWLKVNGSSMDFANKLLDVGVLVTPGIGFGEHGEGYVRFSLTQKVERIKEALERMENIF